MSESTEGGEDVVAADHRGAHGEVGLAVVVAGREDGRLYVKVGSGQGVFSLLEGAHAGNPVVGERSGTLRDGGQDVAQVIVCARPDLTDTRHLDPRTTHFLGQVNGCLEGRVDIGGKVDGE